MSIIDTFTTGRPSGHLEAGVAECRLHPGEIANRWGRSSVGPFLTEPANTVVRVAGGGAAGYRPVRSWAVVPTNPAAPPGLEQDALAGLLDHISARGRRAVFAAVADPYRAIGLHAACIANDASIDLSQFSLSGKRMARCATA